MVTVVIPTYNRAHLLHQTVPSYLQPEVEQLILVDDASQDQTTDTIRDLQAVYGKRVRSIRNRTNQKQTFSKNVGKSLVTTPWIYFGDDDAVLTEGSIGALLSCAASSRADIVGATPLYCLRGETPEGALVRFRESPAESDPQAFVDWSNLRIRHTLRASKNIPLSVTHASFLIRTTVAQKVDFDTRFMGTAYREETDFLLTLYRAGARIFFCPFAQQINLPPEMASGGTRSRSRLMFEWYYFVNTLLFLYKHKPFFAEHPRSRSVIFVLASWAINRAAAGVRKWIA
jgi:glycosyltransferase involved in cell wall biosynthesis